MALEAAVGSANFRIKRVRLRLSTKDSPLKKVPR